MRVMKKTSVIVEAYRHRTPEDAFGIYSQERLPDGNFLTIGAESYIDPHILNFLTGRYHVKINSFKTGAEDREVLQLIAKKRWRRVRVRGEGYPPFCPPFLRKGKRTIPKSI